MLYKKIEQYGYKVAKSEFHRYDTNTGKLIMDWLTRKWDVSQKSIELIMAADKQAQQEWFSQLDKEGYDYLILDRYTLSQAAYGVANGIQGSWIIELQKYMRKPDLDIVIDIPAEISMSRKGKHNNGQNDKYESDLEMLKRVRENYKSFSTYYSAPVKKIVDGTKSIEEIHNEIFNIVLGVGS
jgi:dTMP kinase